MLLVRQVLAELSHTVGARKQKIQNPNSKIQIKKRVCPTRVCPTRVSAHPFAQQLRPQRLKHLNPLFPCILMKKFGCLPHFFSCHQSRGVLHGILIHDRSPQGIRTVMFLQIHRHSEQNIKLEITKKVCKVRLVNRVCFPKILEQTPNMCWKKFARVLFAGEGVGGGCTYQKEN